MPDPQKNRAVPLTHPVSIALTIEAEGWQAALPDPDALVGNAAHAALTAGYTGPAAELSIVLTDNAAVQILNRDYRGQDRPTNVLSFPMQDDPAEAQAQNRPVMLGDVILAYETVAFEARDQGKSLENHLCHLIVHGVLHILGYDHEEEDEAIAMEGLETKVLAGLGVADPYADEKG
jgi:probable rRNA maturation factor